MQPIEPILPEAALVTHQTNFHLQDILLVGRKGSQLAAKTKIFCLTEATATKGLLPPGVLPAAMMEKARPLVGQIGLGYLRGLGVKENGLV